MRISWTWPASFWREKVVAIGYTCSAQFFLVKKDIKLLAILSYAIKKKK